MSLIIEQLQQAKKSLSPETWRKGAYFTTNNNTICMCAHGALQAQANPEVKRILNNHFDLSHSAPAAGQAAAAAAAPAEAVGVEAAPASARARARASARAVAGDAEDAAASSADARRVALFQIWNNRPDWVKKNTTKDGIEYGNLDIHYLLGMVGLTTSFNDDKKTTLEMVHQKFDEAIELARYLSL